MKIKIGILVGILIFYFFLSYINLVKFPPVFPPDEAAFSSAAYSLNHSHDFSDTDFARRLPRIDKTPFTNYGPMYTFGLAAPLTIFGYSIYTIRYFSVFMGLLSLIIFFFLLRKSTQNTALSLIGVGMLAMDFFFLNSARLGRMEIMAILFQLLSFLFYFRTFTHQKRVNYVLIAVFVTAAVFTHFISGLPALVVIGIHSLFFNKKFWKKKESYILPAFIFICMMLWMVYIQFLADKTALQGTGMLITNRLLPRLSSIKLAINDNIGYSWINLIVYAVSYLVMLFKPRKNIFDTFWITFASCAAVISIWGDSLWYMSMVPVAFIPLLLLMDVKQPLFRNKNFLFRMGIVILFVSVNIYQQAKIFNLFREFSYEAFGKQVSDCIEKKNSNVMVYAQPDPYFYLVANRKDLKIAYKKYPDIYSKIFRKSLRKANYIAVSQAYELVMRSSEFQIALKDPSQRADILNFFHYNFAVEPDLLYYIYKNRKKSCGGEINFDNPTAYVYRLQ